MCHQTFVDAVPSDARATPVPDVFARAFSPRDRIDLDYSFFSAVARGYSRCIGRSIPPVSRVTASASLHPFEDSP
ncbi:hypothetical protein [Burkholderia mayonis]|uniref:hypothetical protein n=1 Tax=Burkholderia mayonis TaxID=1385591 RepID=UPI000B0FF653|nr:hypothetical protein [Burkholderia mayonis]